jgi:hypothetical protein
MAGSLIVTLTQARRKAPTNKSAAGEGPDNFPLSREFHMSAPRIADDRRSGAARTSHSDFAVCTATYVEVRIPAAISRLGVRLSQYFLVMLRLLYFRRVHKLEKYGVLSFMTSKLYQEKSFMSSVLVILVFATSQTATHLFGIDRLAGRNVE